MFTNTAVCLFFIIIVALNKDYFVILHTYSHYNLHKSTPKSLILIYLVDPIPFS